MTRFLRRSVFIGATFIAGPAIAVDQCQIKLIAELPITMRGMQPTLVAQINGRDARFMLDSGATNSILSSATAADYHLKLSPTIVLYTSTGIGGTTHSDVTKVKEITVANLRVNDIEFIVTGNGFGSDIVGLLGQNFLENFDVEYDFAHGAARLFHTDNCEHSRLAYWITPDQHYSKMAIQPVSRDHSRTIGTAEINGQPITVMFDSGAGTSVLTAYAAGRAGVSWNSDGVQVDGYSSGIGRGSAKTYLGRFDSFTVGDDEEVKNAKLRFANVWLGADMLLGADFFMSHRIFVANRERKLYLSYNGGPVFDLSKHSDTPVSADSNGASPESTGNSFTGDGEANASDFARRGSVLVAQRDFAAGLPLLSKAIAIAPQDPEFYYQRASGYDASGQTDLALIDFDQVIKLDPNFLPAYIPRAELELSKENKAAALVDLEAVDHLAPKQADLRFTLGNLYGRIDHIPQAIEQFGLWIESHPDDSRLLTAWGARCRDRALLNSDLSAALTDCNRAIARADKRASNNSALFVDRALVLIRMYHPDKAIGDCDEALKLSPKNASALYVRGIGESKNNLKSKSEADLSAAQKIDPKVGARFERYGIAP